MYMTYVEHMKFSMSLSLTLFIASVQAFVHSFLPNLCVHTTTNVVASLDKKLKNSGCKEDDTDNTEDVKAIEDAVIVEKSKDK